MGIRRVECIVDACMLKATTPVRARRRSGEVVCSDAVWIVDFKQDMR